MSDFNSHAHVERDISADVFKQLPCISTHTLTWSVTCIDEVADQCVEISTHTLTWSVTDEIVGNFTKGRISTHTLTWSVTLDVVYIWCLLNVMRTYFFI